MAVTMIDDARFGRWIRRERRWLELTQEEFAAKLRAASDDDTWTNDKVSRLERGKWEIRHTDLYPLAAALGMDRDALLSRIDSDIPGYLTRLDDAPHTESTSPFAMPHIRSRPEILAAS